MINIETLNRYFNQYYEKLYNSEYGDIEAAIFSDMGDSLLKDEKLTDIIRAFCEYRKDFISSDREAAAFALAFYRYEAEENYRQINNYTA